uniref:Uncharacterized protein n=1 Tax=Oryza sativa subsp. japonica TaxID=39947 RepID=Q69SM3_ORYSJ|nr:hypothetical protein [Oryza sativa Japonica Group]
MAKAGKPRRYSESKGILGELQRLRHNEFGIKEAQQDTPVTLPKKGSILVLITPVNTSHILVNT